MEDSHPASNVMPLLSFRSLLAACVALPLQSYATTVVVPMDCTPGRVDNTCAAPVRAPTIPPFPAPPRTPPSTFDLGGIPPFGYWYFGYDFQKNDDQQNPFPQFVNRSGKSISVKFEFSIPAGSCSKDCLPGLEFYKGSSHIYTVDAPLQIKGDIASATLNVASGESYSWVIGLWKSSRPTITISDPAGNWTPLSNTGLTDEPDVAREIPGSTTSCRCSDGSIAGCSYGEHFSNGLLGAWSTTGAIDRNGAWNNCSFSGS